MTWLDDMLAGSVEAGIGRGANLADPYGLGQDLECSDDLGPNLTEIAGVPVFLQDLLHRLITPRGSVPSPEGSPDVLNYGTDAREDVSRGMTAAELAALPGKYAAELEKDDRVQRVDVQIRTQTSEALTVSFIVATTQGPFRYTAVISSAGAIITEGG